MEYQMFAKDKLVRIYAVVPKAGDPHPELQLVAEGYLFEPQISFRQPLIVAGEGNLSVLDKALALGARECRFDSCSGHI